MTRCPIRFSFNNTISKTILSVTNKAQQNQQFTERFVHCQHRVYAFIVTLVPDRDEAEEAFQETSLLLWENWKKFDLNREFVPWACGFAYNVVRNRRRKKRRTVAFNDEFRRLNRLEYEHTLRDLLALPRLEVKEMLPPDAGAHGFDNVGSALRVSYVQMARYLKAARKALEEAAWLAPEVQTWKVRMPFIEMHRFQITYDRITLGEEAVLLRQPNTAQTPWRLDGIQIPFPGTHTIRIRARAATYTQKEAIPEDFNRPKEGRVYDHGKLEAPEQRQIVSVYQGTRLLGSFELTDQAAVYEIEAHLAAERTARSSDEFRLILHVPTLSDWNPKWKKGPYRGPAVVLDWVEIEGPAEASNPRPSYRALFGNLLVKRWSEVGGTPPPEVGELKHPKREPKIDLPNRRNRYYVASDQPVADARRQLADFMERAFRRPLPDGEVDRYLQLVVEALDRQKPFHEAMITGYSAVLASPDFLYFFEEPGRLDDHALASRLSYFLWRSLPDETLRTLADQGKLQEDTVLREQVERMLADPKSGRFIADFTDQWLGLREIRATQPDEELYPEFNDFLLDSMLRETRAFVAEMIEENLPVDALVHTDSAFLNNALADLYDIEGVHGVALRKVSLPADTPRGGLLTQASVLKVTANGTTTSPVMRGTWVLDRLLGTPPPPPPPDVPAIEPDTRGATTVRQLLKKHRADPACASCHARIDPPGFALESFDVIGGWRENYRIIGNGKKADAVVHGQPVNYRHGPVVESHGTTPNGRNFTDIHGFRKILLGNKRQLARNLVERLLVFGTGAGVSFADRADVEAILNQTEKGNYRLRDLLFAVALHDTFRHK